METAALKDYRRHLKLTIKEASEATNVPIRTYIRYENDDGYGDSMKRKIIVDRLRSCFEVTETKGILSLDQIKATAAKVMQNHGAKIEFCYLFGSYAKGYASESSDVDLCVSTTLKGLELVGLIEELRVALHKKVDLLRLSDVVENLDLLKEIMKDGIKIYG